MKRLPLYPDVALLLIRAVLFISFLLHGLQKYNMGIGNVSKGFGSMGVPLSGIVGPGVTILEIVASIALLLGIGTRLFAALLVCDMLGAITFVHAKNGYLGQGGMELVVLLGTMALAIVLAGAGKFSIDSRLGRSMTP